MDFTSNSDGLTLAAGQSQAIGAGEYNKTNNAIVFYVRVLNAPMAMDARYADMLLKESWIPPKTRTDRDPMNSRGDLVRPRIMFRGRVLRASNGLQPHIFLPDPCKMASAATESLDYINSVILQHTLFISNDGNYGDMPKANDVVVVNMRVSDFEGPDLKYSNFETIASTADVLAYEYQKSTACDSLVERFDMAGAGAIYGEFLPPKRPTARFLDFTWEELSKLRKSEIFEPILAILRAGEAGAASSTDICKTKWCKPYGVYNMGTAGHAPVEFTGLYYWHNLKNQQLVPRGWDPMPTATSTVSTAKPVTFKKSEKVIRTGGVNTISNKYYYESNPANEFDIELKDLWIRNVCDFQGLAFSTVATNYVNTKTIWRPEYKTFNNLFAVGAYQIIPKTMHSLIESIADLKNQVVTEFDRSIAANKLPNSPLFNQIGQDVLAIYLLLCKAGNEYNRGKKFTQPSFLGTWLMGLYTDDEMTKPDSSDPTPAELGIPGACLWAGQAMAYEWAFAPVQFNGTDHIPPNKHRGQSAYGGIAGNAANILPETVVEALKAHLEILKNPDSDQQKGLKIILDKAKAAGFAAGTVLETSGTTHKF